MKKIFVLGIISSSVFLSSSLSFAEPTIRQYPYIYKSVRAMGMGGAYTAVGGTTDSIFYNPATLSNMPKSKFKADILTPTFGIGSNVLDFVNDMKDAFDVGDLNGDGDTTDDRLKYVNNVLAKYRGDNMHLNLYNWTGVGRNNGKISLAVGGLASVRMDAMPHQGFGDNGFLEVNADFIGGAAGGVSYSHTEDLSVGLGLKLLHRESLIHNFTAKEIVDNQDNIDDYITKDLRKSGNAVGMDIGLLYKFDKHIRYGQELRPAVGVVLQNIGDLNFKDAGRIPMTLNIGFSISPEIPNINKRVILAIDYIDMFNNFDQDKDIGKRIRIGGEINLWDKGFTSSNMRLGFYQGYLTFGADLKLFMATISYATYAEEIGAYAGQLKDRRHLIMMGTIW